jgi:hypothetical protein
MLNAQVKSKIILEKNVVFEKNKIMVKISITTELEIKILNKSENGFRSALFLYKPKAAKIIIQMGMR